MIFCDYYLYTRYENIKYDHSMKIYISQFKPNLKSLTENANKIRQEYINATDDGADLVAFPELALTGYSPRDDLLSKEYITKVCNLANDIVKSSKEAPIIFGLPLCPKHLPEAIPFLKGLSTQNLYNACIIAQNRKIIGVCIKNHLPNEDIFDESRYFAEGTLSNLRPLTVKGVSIVVCICEDLWHDDTSKALSNADLIISVNASPYDTGKHQKRIDRVVYLFENSGTPIIYINQVLGQDGILYDGSSFCYDGCVKRLLDEFIDGSLIIDFEGGKFFGNILLNRLPSRMNSLYNALVFGVREYVHSQGFSQVIIGLSGGADSALCAVIACEAFGAENVRLVFMPSCFTSAQSVLDANDLAKNLGIILQNIPIDDLLKSYQSALNLSGVAFENIQARIRGNITMSLSNDDGALVLTTGNKSEIAVGYCTLYGDMCGAYNPIKDLYKTEVFELMRWINEAKVRLIPLSIIEKEPSAELRDGQKDSDSLPPYEVLDKILYKLIECHSLPESDLEKRIWGLFLRAEYKRSQSAIGTRVSPRSLNLREWRKNL